MQAYVEQRWSLADEFHFLFDVNNISVIGKYIPISKLFL